MAIRNYLPRICDGVTAHTGTGRISRFTLRPMSLFESNDSNGSVSLRNIFSGNFDIQGESPLTVKLAIPVQTNDILRQEDVSVIAYRLVLQK